jgi:hypothetical protein
LFVIFDLCLLAFATKSKAVFALIQKPLFHTHTHTHARFSEKL